MPHDTTPTPYTSTPWGLCDSGIDSQIRQIVSSPDDVLVGCLDACDTGETRAESNAQIIVASVNSYAKHCGPHAIQCAEDDLLGQALNTLQSVRTDIAMYVSGEWVPDDNEGWELMVENIGKILSRLPH